MSTTPPTSPDTLPMAYQVPVQVPLPTYNWAASDQMQEFCLFKCQLETWTWIHKIKAEEKLNYLLCILGKEGYASMDRWVPADEAHKNDPMKFLSIHREHIRWWDLPMSPCLQAGRHHKEVWWIHQWASRSDMPNLPTGYKLAMTVMLQLSLKFNASWFGQSQMPTSSCTNNFWRSAVTRGYCIY